MPEARIPNQVRTEDDEVVSSRFNRHSCFGFRDWRLCQHDVRLTPFSWPSISDSGAAAKLDTEASTVYMLTGAGAGTGRSEV